MTRREPLAPAEIGRRPAAVAHLANLARELNRKLRWDPEAETFPGGAEANAMLARPRRKGYELPAV